MNGRLVERGRQVYDFNRAKRTAFRADAASGTEHLINARFLIWFSGLNTVCTGPVDRAQFSTKIIATFVRVAFLAMDDCNSLTHGSA